MAIKIRLVPLDREPELTDAVLTLAAKHRSTLGFLPDQAFTERAAAGTLIVAVADGQVAGYALYDLPQHHVALRQLCVAPSHRSQGIASRLVDEVADRHPDRRGIRLRCRNDYAANDMWPRLDFEALHESPGRSVDGHPLTTWWRDFGHPTLFTQSLTDDDRISAAMDTNIVIDLMEDREGSAESAGLLADWVLDHARLFITKEVRNELHSSGDVDKRALARDHLARFDPHDGAATDWQEAERALLAALENKPAGDHDARDVRHVARAHAAGAAALITQDLEAIAKIAHVARRTLGITLETPGEFVRRLWEQAGNGYQPVQIHNTNFRAEPVAADQVRELARVFLDHSQGERLRGLDASLRELVAHPEEWHVEVVMGSEQHPVGLAARSISTDRLQVPILRTAGPERATIARQLVHLQREHALAAGRTEICVADAVHPSVATALRTESFVQTQDGWVGATVPLLGDADDAARELSGLALDAALEAGKAARKLDEGASADEIAQIEDRFWPMKVFGGALPTFLVPIEPHYAQDLFDTALSEATLLTRPASLGLSREHVYFRSPLAAGGMRTPARLLWYVTQKNAVPGSGAVRACSALTEIVVDRPKTLYRRFRHLGVYGEGDLVEAAADGQVMALRFTRTELLHPVSLAQVNAEAARLGRTPWLQSPWRVPDALARRIYERGTHDRR